jgi:CheY-like chemotaxis protein
MAIKPKLLIVEDDQPIVSLLTLTLQEAYDMVVTSSIAELNLLSISPDAIILDLNLPDSNGVKTLELVREKFPNPPIIIFSGYVDFSENIDADAIILKGNKEDLAAVAKTVANVIIAYRVSLVYDQFNSDIGNLQKAMDTYRDSAN